MLLAEFKKAVNRYSPTILSGDLLTAYSTLGLDSSNGCSSNHVTKILYQKIKESSSYNEAPINTGIPKSKLIKLQAELVYRWVLFDENPVEYLQLIRVIQDSGDRDSKYFPPLENDPRWEAIIVNSKNYNLFQPNTFPIVLADLRKDYPKEFDIATSIKKLIDKGCKIEIVNSEITILSVLEDVINELNLKIRQIGGITLAKALFTHLKNQGKYSNRLERYMIIRQTSGISFDQSPQIPFGLLLNLALKHPIENSISKNSQSTIDEIVSLGKTIANGAYGVQPYSMWSFHFQSGETIIEFCTELVLWDTLFSIPQCRPSTSIEIADRLFSFIDEISFTRTLGFTKAELIQVIKNINLIASMTNGPEVIYRSTLAKKSRNLNIDVIQSVLEFLSHTATVNETYSLPSDYLAIDFYKKPLIKLSKTKFQLMDKSWCSPNYYEALATAFREDFKRQGRDLDAELGNQLEFYLQNKLTEKGIQFSSGEYRIDGVDGECDLLIESNEGIILIEFKKKPLTRKAKSGIDINVLLDLSDSILSAQLQAGRTEIFLRERGSITLRSKTNNSTVVAFSDRKIERVALTQLEFGGFQDRTIIKQFLKSLLTHSFGTYSTDANIVRKFEQLTAKQNAWLSQYEKLIELDNGFSRFPFFNCWFLSLPQLIEVINISDSNDSLYKNFTKNKFVTMGTLDWYKEFELAIGVNQENLHNPL